MLTGRVIFAKDFAAFFCLNKKERRICEMARLLSPYV